MRSLWCIVSADYQLALYCIFYQLYSVKFTWLSISKKPIWLLNQTLVSDDWVLGLVLTSFQTSFILDILRNLYFFVLIWLFLASTHLHQKIFLVIISGDIETGRLWNKTSLWRYNKKSQQNLGRMNYSAMEIWCFFFFFNFHMALKPKCSVTGAWEAQWLRLRFGLS